MKSVIFWRTFLNSIKLPNKQAIFALNRIGMDITVIYLFILLLIVSIPALSVQLTTGASADINVFFLLIYFFIFYYLPLTIIIFLLISLFAYFGTGIAKSLKRKIRFSIIWKLVAYTTTIPFLLYTVLAFFVSINDILMGLFFLYTFLFMIKIITVFPKRKTRK
ncbi:hypothetical protein [Lentibacillus sp.]|uniref:hypothetical protein n=1 Tax=Lentibacillus sp. TaxID=1925746 RepID=UPI002B4B954F|nr:hypothetical protein [Lentibacillus sp.]HLS07767.1 hypothetical protein [Lentibacillus sp.]